LKFLIKVNQALASGIDGAAAFDDSIKAQWQEYKPLVIVGPSGAGKGTLIGKLTQKYPDRFGFSVSFTTRGPRNGEVNGVHYFFVDHDQFKAKIEKDEFIEYC
jgi:guanylate kinase